MTRVRILSMPWGQGIAAPIVGFAPPPPPPIDFYVATDGGTGTGSLADPFSLPYALSSAGGQIAPGERGALRGGTYGTGGPDFAFSTTAALAGNAGQPIVFQNFPGERYIIDGALDAGTGSDVQFIADKRNGVFRNSNHHTVGTDRLNITARIPRAKFINLIIHDARASGLGNFQEGTDTECNGLIVFNNGPTDAGSGANHGIYTTTLLAETERLLRHCVSYNNSGYGFHAASSGASQREFHTHHRQCLGFGNSSIAVTPTPRSDFICQTDDHTARPPTDIRFDACCSYKTAAQLDGVLGAGIDNLQLGGNVGIGGDVTLQDCYFFGGIRERDYASITIRNSSFLAAGKPLWLRQAPGAYTLADIDQNAYGHRTAWAGWQIDSPLNTYNTLALWQAASFRDGASTGFNSATGLPTLGQVTFVWPSIYEFGRAIITIYNYDLSVTLDFAPLLSSFMPVGAPYEIHNIQAMSAATTYGDPSAVSGIYTGETITVSLAGITPPAPLDRAFTAGAVTGPLFNTYLVHLS